VRPEGLHRHTIKPAWVPSIRARLREIAANFLAVTPERCGWVYSCPQDLVAREGREYVAGEVPGFLRGLPAWEPHRCFELSARAARDHPQLTYVEGFAGDMTVHHAWLIDRHGRVIDLTWPLGSGAEYVGIALDTASLTRSIRNSGVHTGSLADPALLRWGFGAATVQRATEPWADVPGIDADGGRGAP
jgi:hypothetical protein